MVQDILPDNKSDFGSRQAKPNRTPQVLHGL